MAKNLFTVSGPPAKRDAGWPFECFWWTFLLSQITAKHLNFPAKEPWARSNCLPWKLQLDPNEARVSNLLTWYLAMPPPSKKHSLSPCGCQLVPLGSAVLSLWWSLGCSCPGRLPRRWWAQSCRMNQALPRLVRSLGPFLAQVLLVVWRGDLLPWLLCPHQPFLPAIGTVKHPRDSSFKAMSELPPCRNTGRLLSQLLVLHWRVAFYWRFSRRWYKWSGSC